MTHDFTKIPFPAANQNVRFLAASELSHNAISTLGSEISPKTAANNHQLQKFDRRL